MEENEINISPGGMAWIRFKKNRMALFGVFVIVVACVIAVLGGIIRPDSSMNANDQQLSLSKKGINFSVQGVEITLNTPEEEQGFWRQMFFGGASSNVDFMPVHSFAFKGDSITGFRYGGGEAPGEPFKFHLMDIVYPIAESPESPSSNGNEAYRAKLVDGGQVSAFKSDLIAQINAEFIPNRLYLFGTDKFGRDLLSRLMAGTIVSLSVGLISVLISLVLGIGLGAIAGYYGGWVDDLITWLINVIWSIPTLLLVIAITFALGKGFVQVFIAVGLTMWVEVARVVRGQVMSLKNQSYIEAARAMGFGPSRIIFKHIIPNILGPVIVVSAANFASAILLEAGLSFLGIGAQIPMASWGQMIKEHYAYITTEMAYLAILPGLCILVLVLAFMLIGSGLRDSVDTRTA